MRRARAATGARRRAASSGCWPTPPAPGRATSCSRTGRDACKVFCIVNDRKLPLTAPLTAEEGRRVMGFLFHCKDEGSSQTSYRRASFQGFSIRAGGSVPLPGGISALRCERGPHDPDADHLFARLFYTDRLDPEMTLERLGFTAEEAALFAEIRMAMQGGVFIGGRAGDGKSTTLAVNLALQMAEMEGCLNLVTLEDPVEYRIPGAIQIAVPTAGAGETRAGHFSQALMHFCRVHPASGMVSEIRDADAARQVLQCVDTGHQIWTTIHVHNANAIPFRLIDMGVGAAEVAKPGNVALLMKQTLLPKLCPACALDRPAGGRAVPEGLAARLGGLEGLRFRNAEGCAECRREDARRGLGQSVERLSRPDRDRGDHPAGRGLSAPCACGGSARRLDLVAARDGRGAHRGAHTRDGEAGFRGSLRCAVEGRGRRARGAGRSTARGSGGGRCWRAVMIGRLGTGLRRLHAALVMGRKARVDCFQTVADLLDAGFELERALGVTARALGGTGGRARMISSWRAALPQGRFAQAMASSVPPAEAMIFEAYGRVEAGRLFAAAARVAELRERQMSAVRKALAMPILLGIALVTMLWAARAAGSSRCWRAWCRRSAGVRPRRCSAPPRRGCSPIPCPSRSFAGPLPCPWVSPWSTGPGRGAPRSTASRPSRSTAPSPARPSCSWCSSSWAPGSISTTAPSRTSGAAPAPTPGTASARSSATWRGARAGARHDAHRPRLSRPGAVAGGGGARRGAGLGGQARRLRRALGGPLGGPAQDPRRRPQRGALDPRHARRRAGIDAMFSILQQAGRP